MSLPLILAARLLKLEGGEKYSFTAPPGYSKAASAKM